MMKSSPGPARAAQGVMPRQPWAVALLVLLGLALPVLPFVLPVNQYIVNIFMQTATYSIAVLGLTVVLGYAGQINLAQAAFFGIGAYAVGLGTTSFGLSFWLSMLLGIGAGALAGVVLGMTTLRLGGHYLAMITIGFQEIFDLSLTNFVDFTHGPDGIAGIARPSLFGYQLADDRAYLLFCAAVLYVLAALVWYLPNTRLGRAMRAVRENELAAEVTGINTLAVKVIAFTLGAVLASIGGALYAAGFAYISPDNFNFSRSVEFLTMGLLGGIQSPLGAMIGTALLILLPEWLRFLKQIYLAAYGIAVILIMVFLPEGIWGFVRLAQARLSRGVAYARTAVAPLVLKLPAGGDAALLSVTGLAKHFGGVKAVDGVDLDVRRGTIHALIGPNGSGKTTTLNVLSGIYAPTGGRIAIDGIDVTQRKPHERAACGMGRTFQNIRLFTALSALENVMVGAQRAHNPVPAGDAALRRIALEALEFVGLAHDAQTLVSQLPYGHQRLVEIARALAGQPSLLLLDEPAAGLNQTEKQALVGLLKRLREQGLTIFLIEHDMGLILQISDVITVLNFGRKIAEGAPGTVMSHPDVVTAYLGESAHGAAGTA